MSILGNRVLRKEDPKFLTVGGTYVYDLKEPLLEGALHVTYVRSTVAHARLLSVDTTEAAAAPGVVAVLTAESLGLTPQAAFPFTPQFTSTPLALGKVRYVGEPIAAIVSVERSQGVDAADLVVVDYDPLPAVIDLDEALAGTTLLWEEVGSNVAMDSAMLGRPAVTDDSFFEGCEVVVKQRVLNQRVAPSPLETRSAAAAWTPEGRLVYWVSSQHVQGAKQVLDAVYGTEANVRVIAPDVGGGFGAKIGIYPDEILLGGIAKALGRPVRWTETRSESMVALGHGRAQLQDIEVGGLRDGTVLAYRLVATQDCGAYPAVGTILAPFMTLPMSSAVYAIPKIECQSRSVVTTTTPIVAYRGAGRPEATAAAERAMDLFAAEIGMDPVEVRRKNLIPKFLEPHTTAVGQTYDVGDYEGALDKVLAHADYAGLRAEQAARRASGDVKQLGIGVSVYVEITGGAPQLHEFGHVIVNDDGTATVYTGTSPHGQGHATAWSMLVQEQTGIAFDKVTVIHGDTDLVPEGGGTMGSRSLQQGGSAVYEAAGLIVDKAKELAAKLLEASVDDVVLDKGAGAFHVAGTPAVAKTWAELAVAAKAAGDPLDIRHRFDAGSATFPFGAHLSVVEVDTETGETRLVRHVAVDDAGKVLNPTLLEGQIHGGIAQGAAQALLEEVRYDDDGNPITSNLADYAFISMAELPSFEVLHMETPTFVNPLGAKGVGESGTIGSTPAVQSAVCDALAHLGVRHIDMPATAERVWRAIDAATSR